MNLDEYEKQLDELGQLGEGLQLAFLIHRHGGPPPDLSDLDGETLRYQQGVTAVALAANDQSVL